jgi:ribulose-5-phosphate 4-epimerase/fuculose-1-phosphate aldolase
MAESYKGTKFKTVFLRRNIPSDPRIKKLIIWGNKFSLFNLTPAYEFGAAGNLSFRTEFGFIITGTGKDLGNLKEEDFVEVLGCDLEKNEVIAAGKIEPSSETLFHYVIYQKRPDVNVIFHVHDDYAVKNCEELGFKCTEKEAPYGTVELADEIAKSVDNTDYLVVKNHGIISLGSETEETGDRILEVNSKLKVR